MIHPSAHVSDQSKIGKGTRIWDWAQIREGASIGQDCNLGKSVYIDRDVVIGDKVKIQNNVSVFEGVTIEDGVFVGPHVCFTNDKLPRAVNNNFEPSGSEDWQISPILVKRGASIGANSTILPGVVIGRFAMVGAGSVVTKDVADFALVVGNPARVIGRVDESGRRVT
jgi:UDP-2-acetamido-3-amino-2,3-dideoxy-glucuronate N-acetyltransferase